MINDKDRIRAELQNGAKYIEYDGEYYLVYENSRALIHKRTFYNVQSILEKTGKNRWKLK